MDALWLYINVKKVKLPLPRIMLWALFVQGIISPNVWVEFRYENKQIVRSN